MIDHIPDDATLRIEGYGAGDEDYTNTRLGSFNVSKAKRILQRFNAPCSQASMSREDALQTITVNDIDEERVRYYMEHPQEMETPCLSLEYAPDEYCMIDGHHKLAARYRMSADDPLTFPCYLFPHQLMELIRIRHYVVFDDGRREELSPDKIMQETWGRFMKP